MTSMIELCNPAFLAATIAAKALTPPPPINYTQWAEENITFKTGTSFIGPYRRETFQVWEKVLSWLQPDDACEEVYAKKSAQCGGTIAGQIFLLGSTCLMPTSFMFIHPTSNTANRWFKEKLKPMVNACPPAREAFGPLDGRENSMDLITRRDGLGIVNITNAGSENSLASFSAQNMIFDELSKWVDNAAGNPESQADSRMGGVLEGDGKKLKISTPLVKPGCRISDGYDKGTQTKLYIACPNCCHEHSLEWENFKANIKKDDLDDVFFSCPECRYQIYEGEKNELVREAHLANRYVDENPNPARGIKSIHTWVANFSVKSLAWIAQKWLDAEGDPESEKNFFNDILGLAYEVAGAAPASEKLKKRYDETGHTRRVIPSGHPILTVGVDVQDGWLAYQVVAFGPNYHRAMVEYDTVDFDIESGEGVDFLNDLLNSKWRNVFGYNVSVDYLAIDGGNRPDAVKDWVKTTPRSKVMMVRGVDTFSTDVLKPVLTKQDETGKRRRRVKRSEQRWYNLAVSGQKSTLYRNLTKIDPEMRGYIACPRHMPESYYEELTAEVRVAKSRGKGMTPVYKWEKPAGKRNEALDTMNYAEAAALKIGWRKNMGDENYWDWYFEKRERPPESVQLDLEDQLLVPPVKSAKIDPETGEVFEETAPETKPVSGPSKISMAEKIALAIKARERKS